MRNDQSNRIAKATHPNERRESVAFGVKCGKPNLALATKPGVDEEQFDETEHSSRRQNERPSKVPRPKEGTVSP